MVVMPRSYFLCIISSCLVAVSLHATQGLFGYWSSLLATQWQLKKIFVETMNDEEIELNEFGRFSYNTNHLDKLIEQYKNLPSSDEKIKTLTQKSALYIYKWDIHSPEIIKFFTDFFIEEKFWLYFQKFHLKVSPHTEYNNIEESLRESIINAANNYIDEKNSLPGLHIWHLADMFQLFLTHVGTMPIESYKLLVAQNEFLGSLKVNWAPNVKQGTSLHHIFSNTTPTNLTFADKPRFNISFTSKKKKEEAILEYMHNMTVLGYYKGFIGFFDWTKELQQTFFNNVNAAGYDGKVHEILYEDGVKKMKLSLAGWGIISGSVLIAEKEPTEKAALEVIEWASTTKDKLEKYLQHTSTSINSPYKVVNCGDFTNITFTIRYRIFKAFLSSIDRERILFEAIKMHSGMYVEKDENLANQIKLEIAEETIQQEKSLYNLLRKRPAAKTSSFDKNKPPKPILKTKPEAPKVIPSLKEVEPQEIVLEKKPKAKKKKKRIRRRGKKTDAVALEKSAQEQPSIEGYILNPPAVKPHEKIVAEIVKKNRKEIKRLRLLPTDEQNHIEVKQPTPKIKMPSIKKLFKTSWKLSRFSPWQLGDYFPHHFLVKFQTVYDQQEQNKINASKPVLEHHPMRDASRYLGESEKALKTLYEDRLELFELIRTVSDRRNCRQLFLTHLGISTNVSDEEIEKRVSEWHGRISYDLDDKIREHINLVNSLMNRENLDMSLFWFIQHEMNRANGIFVTINSLNTFDQTIKEIREQFLAQERLIKEYYERLNEMLLENEKKYSIKEINALYMQKWNDVALVMENFQNIFSDEFIEFKTCETALRDLGESILALRNLSARLE